MADHEADRRAVEEYERLLLEAPPEGMDEAQLAAFEKLSTTQLDILFAKLNNSAPDGESTASPNESVPNESSPNVFVRLWRGLDENVASAVTLGASVLGAVAVIAGAVSISAAFIPDAQSSDSVVATQDGSGGGPTESGAGATKTDAVDQSKIDPGNIDLSGIDVSSLYSGYDFWY